MAVRTPERLLDGRYRIVRRLGSGGMASVFLAEDERLGRLVAVKRLHGEISDEDVVRRFQREARLGASLNHPNIVAVYDIAADPEGVLIVMEHVEGHTLREEIASGPLPAERALPILRGVGEALDHAHGLGVLHRDVKPANVLLRTDGAVKLADLGIATAAEQSRITRSGAVLGTAAYMAPERLDGAAGDHRVDVYALTSVAFETLAGRKAVEGATPLEVARRVVSQPPPDLRDALPEAPAAAAAALRRGLAKDPADRPGSAGELVAELVRAFAAAPKPRPTAAMKGDSEATVLPSAPMRYTGQDSGGKRRAFLVAACVAVLAVVALFSALSVGGGSSDRSATRATGAKKSQARRPAAVAAAPAAAVTDFYQRAARHDYQGAWSLATSAAQRQLGGLVSFSRGQSTLRSISFPVLRTVDRTADAATVELRSNAVHTTRIDHVCGTVGLVRSGSAWLLDEFNLDTCRQG
jgi:eukaryotic-like serine/threonine-protein kinase